MQPSKRAKGRLTVIDSDERKKYSVDFYGEEQFPGVI